VLFLSTAVGASVITHKYIEIPLRDAVRRAFRKRRVLAGARA
jgi:peptidoglycan/LPS O-acetylase OafA/YrhL